jgi:hypothetical protein
VNCREAQGSGELGVGTCLDIAGRRTGTGRNDQEGITGILEVPRNCSIFGALHNCAVIVISTCVEN